MSASASPYASVSGQRSDRDSDVSVPAIFIVGDASWFMSGGNSASSFTSRPALMSPGMGSTSPMYAACGNRGAVDTPAANQGPLGKTFTLSKPGDGLHAFADNASVTVVNPSSDALTHGKKVGKIRS